MSTTTDSPAVERISYATAINRALTEEMSRDERVFVMGQDVGQLGGVFGVTQGLQKTFGADRVIDTAIVEHGIVGGAAGAAMGGLRPVAEVQFADFLMLAGDETSNKLGKWRYIHGGVPTLPVVVRAPMGALGGVGAEHSQCLEGVFWHQPGLRIVVPSTPADAKGLLKSAIRCDDPVLFFEHRRLYWKKDDVPTSAEHLVPFGVAATRRAGEHVTIVTWSAMVHTALAAADQVAEHGVSVEVLDLRTLQPLDFDAVAASVTKTGRVLVLHEAVRTMGPGAEIAALVADRLFEHLDAPVRRLGGLDTPIPQAAELETQWYPSTDGVAAAILELARW
jgi:pyruvate dehydrogenase E1 component beta subunit